MGVAITKKLAFLPPTPPTYDRSLRGLFFIKSKNGKQEIPILAGEPEVTDTKTYTILYTHGNATDLGQLVDFVGIVVEAFNVRIFCYDYGGYGCHTVKEPSESQCYQDIQRVYEYLTLERHLDSSRIILWGTSLGTGLTTDLAARLSVRFEKVFGRKRRSTATSTSRFFGSLSSVSSSSSSSSLNHDENVEEDGRPRSSSEEHAEATLNVVPLAGVILQSPLLSCVRVVSNTLHYLPLTDMFDNWAKISNVSFPVFIMHGTADEVVPFEHGQQLAQRARSGWRFLQLEGGHHNDLTVRFWGQVRDAVRAYLTFLERRRGQPAVPAALGIKDDDSGRRASTSDTRELVVEDDEK